ncbi:MAG: DNA-directed RNA polymerase subunit omega [Phascolarctobacterium sp.]|nr:DNA-directed RNA polymerase subunit omega [Candidatus Phascolarctobacterium caballi]
MVDPSIDELAEKADSKYTLVILAAKRAREINKEHTGENLPEKEVSMAFKEIIKSKITYAREKK